jgi:hypothetical protein
MENLAPALVFIALIAFVAFGQWLQHQRRVLIHRERLVAAEKGIELPPLEQEVVRRQWNVQRILLLAGLIWISIGVTVFVVLSAVAGDPTLQARGDDIPRGLHWIGIAPIGIGLAHLAAYLAGRNKD